MTTILDTVGKPKGKRKYRFSELFGNTIQGEGIKTGIPTAWLRLFGCSLNCHGFGQTHPDRPETWELPQFDMNLDEITHMDQLPIFHRGCDSSFSWSKKFAHLAQQETAEVIVDRLEALLPGGTWRHPRSGQPTHMAFTGGEPMMSQTAIVDIMGEMAHRGNVPVSITVETNGTQRIRPAFREYFAKPTSEFQGELFWSVSPKIYTSGEAWSDAIHPQIVAEYAALSPEGQLKFVCNNTQRAWDEVERAVDEYRAAGVDFPVWIMPEGSNLEGQEKHAGEVADEAIRRGYNVAARVHVYLWGNAMAK